MSINDFRVIRMMMMSTSFDQIEKLNPYGAIPRDTNNGDYRKYLTWLAAGYTPEIIDAEGNVIQPASYLPPGE